MKEYPDYIVEHLSSPRGSFLLTESRKPLFSERLIINALRKLFPNCYDHVLSLEAIYSLPNPKKHKKQWNRDAGMYNPPYILQYYITFYAPEVSASNLLKLEKETKKIFEITVVGGSFRFTPVKKIETKEKKDVGDWKRRFKEVSK